MYTRRYFISAVASLTSVQAGPAIAVGPVCAIWPEWQFFKNKFIQADGRVVDFAAEAHSTSEGQAYALFFALVANDRLCFDRVLSWTRSNLAGGDLTSRLMAWKWGKRSDGNWGVIDANAASDADLWLAYVLYQAGRLWRDLDLKATAEFLQARIAKELVIQIANEGPVLLPGPNGFGLSSGGWKLNPSYMPIQVLRGLAFEVPNGPWSGLVRSTLSMLNVTTPHRLVADWVALRPGRGFVLDAEVGTIGSYDAIRCYLWAGMLSQDDPERQRLLTRMKGMVQVVEKQLAPPEKIDAMSGRFEGGGPAGFSAALLPYLNATKAEAAISLQRTKITAMGGIPSIYYEQVLSLFAFGWMDQRFRFGRDGRLVIKKNATCKK